MALWVVYFLWCVFFTRAVNERMAICFRIIRFVGYKHGENRINISVDHRRGGSFMACRVTTPAHTRVT